MVEWRKNEQGMRGIVVIDNLCLAIEEGKYNSFDRQ